MQTLGGDSAQKPHPLEKFLRLLILGGLIYGGIKLFNYFAPELITAFQNFWVLVLAGVPAVALILYVVSNPGFIWSSYKNLCRKITSFFIKLDFLSYMDSYVEILKDKRKNLKKSKEFITGKKVKLSNEISKIVKRIEDNLKLAKAAKQLNDNMKAGHYASMASGDKQTLEIYQPMETKIKANILFLDKLDENWGYSIEKLEHEVERLRTQYETMSEMAKALGQAEEFAAGDTEHARIYKMSVSALEESLSQKIATIEEFEKNSKNVMGGIDLEKQVMNNEGMDLLDQYMQNDSLFLPADFGTTKDIEAQIISSKPLSQSSKNNEFADLMKK